MSRHRCPMTDLYQPADAQTRGLARAILAAAKTACLGVNDPATGAPFVTLVAFALVDGAPALLYQRP